MEKAALYGCLLPYTLNINHIKCIRSYYGNLQSIYSRCDFELDKLPLSGKMIEVIKQKRSLLSLESLAQQLEQTSTNIITFFDVDYPHSFYSLPTPPLLLFTYGDVSLLNAPNRVGIVGSRKPHSKSLYRLENQINLFHKNTVVISGFAEGVDLFTIHKTVENGIKMIIVLPCGIDFIDKNTLYPWIQDIIETGGLIISEFPLKTPSYRSNYPIRNKTIAALANTLIAVDNKPHSGTSLTVHYAQSLNKHLFEIQANNLKPHHYAA